MGSASHKIKSEPEQDQSEEEVKKQIKEAFDNARKDIKVVLAGKSSSGKTTLFNSLLGKKAKVRLSASSVTSKVKVESCKKNGVRIHIVDTPTLEKSIENQKQSQIAGEIDLILYCLPVGLSTKFEDENPKIMECLQAAYTADVWRKCVVIFTFSNQVWGRIDKSTADQEAKIHQYTDYLRKYAEGFQNQLIKLGVRDIAVTTIFHEGTSANPDQDTIMAIPAGEVPDDRVLTGVDMQHTKQWIDEIFLEMIRNCAKDSTLALLRYQMDDVTLDEKIHEAATAVTKITTKIANRAGRAANLGRKVGEKAEKLGGVVGAIIGTLESHQELSELHDIYKK